MDFKKKLKVRRITAIIFIALGILLIAVSAITKNDNPFISSYGLALAVIGVARLRQLSRITRSEDSERKREIAENDERNILIAQKAKSMAFFLFIVITGIAVIVLSLLKMQETAALISYPVCILVVLYWICYYVYQKLI